MKIKHMLSVRGSFFCSLLAINSVCVNAAKAFLYNAKELHQVILSWYLKTAFACKFHVNNDSKRICKKKNVLRINYSNRLIHVLFKNSNWYQKSIEIIFKTGLQNNKINYYCSDKEFSTPMCSKFALCYFLPVEGLERESIYMGKIFHNGPQGSPSSSLLQQQQQLTNNQMSNDFVSKFENNNDTTGTQFNITMDYTNGVLGNGSSQNMNIFISQFKPRQRHFSECSDDFICFKDSDDDDDDDEDEDDNDQDQVDAMINYPCKNYDITDNCGNHYEDNSRSCKEHCQKPVIGLHRKKVRFDLKPEVHKMITWNFAYRASRKGNWEDCARDRMRFQQRIQRAAVYLDPILHNKHRRKIYMERFREEEET